MGYWGNRKGQFTSTRELWWTGPDTEGGFQVSRQGEQGEQGEQGADHVYKLTIIQCMYAMNERYQLRV